MKWAFYLLIAGTLISGVMAFTSTGKAAPEAKESGK